MSENVNQAIQLSLTLNPVLNADCRDTNNHKQSETKQERSKIQTGTNANTNASQETSTQSWSTNCPKSLAVLRNGPNNFCIECLMKQKFNTSCLAETRHPFIIVRQSLVKIIHVRQLSFISNLMSCETPFLCLLHGYP